MATAFSPRGNAIRPILFKDETSYGVLPTGNWTPTLIYSHSLEEKQPYQDDNIIGQSQNNNRDVTAPEPGLPSLAGDIDVPLDLSHFGYWLRAVMGAPVTSGANPNYTHVFSSGSEVLPHRSIELPINSAGLFIDYTGLLANKMAFNLAYAPGYDHCTLSFMGRKELKNGTTQGGAPSAIVAREPIVRAIPVLKINSTIVGSILTAKVDYDNGAVPQNFIGDQYPQGHDLDNMAKLTASMNMRFRDSTYYDLARAQSVVSAEFLWQNNANRSLSLLCANARLEPAGIPVKGPGGIEVAFNIRAEQTAGAAALVATLKSSQPTF